ncbi:hypothetical protein [Oricola indica]|uniref:hypothetical protein n=1 Tax=Oricola indica TaxID=2872591 RepID=UPI003CCC0AE8
MNQFLGEHADRWIDVGRKPFRASNNLWIKPSIRGIIIKDGIVSPVVAVTRRSILFDMPDVLPFVMRGGYEFHLRDDPNFHDLIVLDLTTGNRGQARKSRCYRLSESHMMSLDQFEYIVSTYGTAAAESKYGLHLPGGMSISDLFRQKDL